MFIFAYSVCILVNRVYCKPIIHLYFPSYYKVVVIIDPLQGLYAILLGDTVDWYFSPTTRWLRKGSNHSLFV